MGGTRASIGRSKAKLLRRQLPSRTDFADVAGIEDAKEELAEIVDFLRNPDSYRRLGGHDPQGRAALGPPGHRQDAPGPGRGRRGQRAVLLPVGVGVRRDDRRRGRQPGARPLRAGQEGGARHHLHRRARRHRAFPERRACRLGGHDEREQTLNQILTEMDGFTGSEGVIVLAATNRPEILDAALMRPGRFDRRVVVSPPDLTGRQAILEVHTRNVPLADDVDLAGIAASTPGMVGADLKNLVNEAALMAARRNHDRVQQADFTDAFEKIVLGTARTSCSRRRAKERTAYHESGHALLGMLQPGGTRCARSRSSRVGGRSGVTFQAPDADRYDSDAAYLRGRIVGMLGGRAAEEVVYGNVTTGAESDLEKVTQIARQHGRALGHVRGHRAGVGAAADRPTTAAVPSAPTRWRRGPRSWSTPRSAASSTSATPRRSRRLRENRDQLDSLAQALLERETLDELDVYRAAGVGRPARAAVVPSLSKGGTGAPAGRPAGTATASARERSSRRAPRAAPTRCSTRPRRPRGRRAGPGPRPARPAFLGLTRRTARALPPVVRRPNVARRSNNRRRTRASGQPSVATPIGQERPVPPRPQ